MLMRVKRYLAYSLVIACALSLAGCRQADGALPPATGDVPNQLGDISRDLWNAANAKTGGLEDLTGDLSFFAQQTTGGEAATAELSKRLEQGLKGKTFMVADALPLAHSCWVAVAGRQLSEKQVENLQGEVKAQLMTLGVDEMQAQNITAQVGAVQQAVTARHRRWYELL
jgi:hypothetical protein